MSSSNKKDNKNDSKQTSDRYNILIDIITNNEDISNSNIISNTTTTRIYMVLAVVLCCYFIIIFRLIDVSMIDKDDLTAKQQINFLETTDNERADILDRNGVILATSLPTQSLYARPEQILDGKNNAKLLADIISKYNQDTTELESNILSKLTSAKNFVWIKRHLLPEEYYKIKKLGIPGVYFADDKKRFYPHENSLAHVVGFVDIDGNGIAGIEKYYNDSLVQNNIITLSIDSRIQAIVREKLNEAIIEHEAIGGMAIIMNAKNGELISMVSLPDFNPNGLGIKEHLQHNPDAMFNRSTLGVYEMGSTFKILTIAIGLDINAVKLSDSFNIANPIKLGKYQIHDYNSKKANMSLAEVLIYSSNKGVIQVGYKIGIEKQQEYMRNIGMLSPVQIEMHEVSRPLHVSKKQWSDIYLATISYGHGIAVTGLHTVQAIATVVNGGLLYKPTLLKRTDNSEPIARIFKEETSLKMRRLMRLVVQEGFSKKAEVPGYNIGGKTGTAEKVKHGKYVKKNCNLALFIGGFPIDDPQYILFVAVDEAKPNQKNYGFTTGGMIAAPLAANIIRETAYLLGVEPR